jgi:hypothetical protein
MRRHYGGVRGTTLGRGICPDCGRDVAGGFANRSRSKVWLRKHKRLVGEPAVRRQWCPGGESVVPLDQDATIRWGLAKRQRDMLRRVLIGS